jgi:hypothetical protein
VPDDTIHLKAAFVGGWISGGAYALKTSAEIANLAPAIDLFCELLGAELDERTREAEPGLQPDPANSHRPGEDRCNQSLPLM